MKTNNRIAAQYCRSVRSCLPGGQMRRAIMERLCETVDAFVAQHPEADLAALRAQFGQPEQIAATYVESMGTPQLLKALRIRRRVLFIAVATALALLLSWGVCVTCATLQLKNAMDIPYIEVSVESDEMRGDGE